MEESSLLSSLIWSSDNPASEALVWSVESFRKRVDSFLGHWWTSKPIELSPLVCARYGWSCIGKDLLTCVECQAHVAFKGTTFHKREILDNLIKSFLKSLHESHHELCVWNNATELHQYECFAEETADMDLLMQLLTRWKSLAVSLKEDEITVSLDFWSHIMTNYESMKKQIDYKDYFAGQNQSINGAALFSFIKEMPKEENKLALGLALGGFRWKDSASETMECTYCFGELHLKKKNMVVVANKRQKLSENDSKREIVIDPLKDGHRHYCPWLQQHIVQEGSKGEIKYVGIWSWVWHLLQISTEECANDKEMEVNSTLSCVRKLLL